MPNRNSTITAPMYTITCDTATNSAAARMYCAAMPASTIASHSAAWTTFLVVTTHSAAKIITAAMMPKPMFCATFTPSAARNQCVHLPAPASSSGASGTVSIHSPSFSLSCRRSAIFGSEYSYSGLQNSASNGHTSTQMPQYMHSA